MEYSTVTPEQLIGPLNEVEEKNAPKELFVRGDTGLFLTGPSVSIVGSREASEKGLIRAAALSRMLVERGVNVVSGLAEGIDTAAHLSAIEHGGRTIAVIGTPVNEVYPKKNKELQELIAKEHLLVSQFRRGVPTRPSNFPMRNRTMALLSDATVIVEAKDKSGSLHQGWEAQRLGRPLFIMESAVQNDELDWPKEFLRYGAQILTKEPETVDLFFDLLPQDNRESRAEVTF